jgi:uncharacterized protein YunC (DUF1805 family)
MALSDGSELTVVWNQDDRRILCSESMGHADSRMTAMDVLVAGSHSAVCAVELVIHLRLRGLIGHAAGPGLDDGGIAGLQRLDLAGVPAAAVSGDSAPIADGLAMYKSGIIGAVNNLARSLGICEGMSCRDAALIMAERDAEPVQIVARQNIVFEDSRGKVIALDTIAYGDERINGNVICMGSHSGQSMADYVEQYRIVGSITNDAGNPPERSAVKGLDRLAVRGIPAAVVDNDTARVGDGVSTWETGVVSEINNVAEEIGISPGMTTQEAALIMLEYKQRSETP